MKRPCPHEIAKMARRLADERLADRTSAADAALRLLEAGYRAKQIAECLDPAMSLVDLLERAGAPRRVQ